MCMHCLVCFFFKQKTAYEMRISDWSSDVCSSDLTQLRFGRLRRARGTDRTRNRRRQVIVRPGLVDEAEDLALVDRADDRVQIRIAGQQDAHRIRVQIPGGSQQFDAGERKRVVVGQGVSQGVDLGGRSIITKKINKRRYKKWS